MCVLPNVELAIGWYSSTVAPVRLFGAKREDGDGRAARPALALASSASSASASLATDSDRSWERALVARAQSGDRAALGELLSHFGPILYRSVLLPRIGSEAGAKDALSETYARVVEKVHLFVWREVGFYPWLRTVAFHVAIDQIRAKKRLVPWAEEDLTRELDEASRETPLDVRVAEKRDAGAVQAKIEAALSRITPRYAQVIRLRVIEEKPRLDVALALGVTPATFDVVLHRALAALKKELAE